MFKKSLLFLFLLFLLIAPWKNIFAQSSDNVNIYFFWGKGCPHCEKEKPFLEKLKNKYPEVKVYDFEISASSENRQLMTEIGKNLNVNVSGVPFTVVGEKHFIGWYDEKSTGVAIEEAVLCAINDGCSDIGEKIPFLKNLIDEKNGIKKDCECGNGCECEEECDCKSVESSIPSKINVPFFGEIDTKNFSLPLLTLVFGALDGFNPCAMWVLLFLISLLLGMENKKRMWILGSVFIIASASVYFIFMVAWLNLILFIGFVFWVRIIIGLVALFGGGYNLKEYFANPTAQCKVTGTEKRQKIFEKLKKITQQKSFYLALGGIIILAFAVNLVELLCSAGLPAVYTQVLAMNNLANWQYYSYILLYVFIFMLDDLLVFFVAMKTLQITGVTSKYSRYSHLIGGILMLIIGAIMILRPEWLMFG